MEVGALLAGWVDHGFLPFSNCDLQLLERFNQVLGAFNFCQPRTAGWGGRVFINRNEQVDLMSMTIAP